MTTGFVPAFLTPKNGRRDLNVALAALALVAIAVLIAALPIKWAAIGVAGAFGGVGLLLQPAVGLLLVAIAIPWGRLVPLPVPVAGITDLLVALTALAWLARGVAHREIRFWLPPLALVLGVFAWFAALSLTQAMSWRDGLPEWIKWGEFALLYLIGAQVLDRRLVPWLLAALFAAGISQAALGAYQFLRQIGPEAFVVLGRYLRAYGTFEQPNPYAGYLGYLAPVSASMALWRLGKWWRERRTPDLALAASMVLVTAGLASGIVMSWSRGAWLGLAAASVAVVGFRSKRATLLAATLVGVALAVTVMFGTGWLPSPIESRVADLGSYFSGPDPARTEIDDANYSVLERLAHWRAGIRMFEDHPWLGVGIGNYGAVYPRYALPHWYEPLGHAHNVFINFLAEVGFLGAASFLVFWIGIAMTAATRIRRSGLTGAVATGLLGTWVYLTVHSLFDNLFVQHSQLQLALLLSGLVTLARTPEAAPALPPTKRTRGYTISKPMRYTTQVMSSQLPPLLAWLVGLPLVNRLGLANRPRELVRFLKFAAVGAFGAVVDLTVLNILHKYFGLHLLVANTISVTVAIISNFTWNRLWTFPESRERALVSQLGQFAIVNVIGLGINNVVLWIMTHLMSSFVHDPWNYNIAKLFAIGVVLFWNFFVNRTWTYRGIE